MARWSIDPVHSEILFAIRYLMISTIRGRFDHFSGYIGFAEGHPLPAVVEVEIDAASIDTGNAERDTHLRSPDFFDVATYPTIFFVSRDIEPLSATQFQITGDLRLHGVSREVILQATFEGIGHDPWGNTRAGFTAITQMESTPGNWGRARGYGQDHPGYPSGQAAGRPAPRTGQAGIRRDHFPRW